jgi:hypothetical protein
MIFPPSTNYLEHSEIFVYADYDFVDDILLR